ncbi:MAG TPA: hypothetical protein VFA07_14570 [Chthonomonadaceae bacterium]|nr:hypothetical protein [Chthonomonadaceae bacterium]
MKTNNERPASHRNDPKARGCCFLVPGILLIGIIAIIVIYVNDNRPPDIVIPTPAMPTVNAYNDFVLAGQMARGMQHKTPYDALPQQQQQEQSSAYLAAFHKDAGPVLIVLRRGLTKPYLQPLGRTLSDDLKSIGTHASFRELARTVAGEAEYYRHNGQPARAANVLLDGMELGVMIPHGGGLIAGFVGIACEAVCIHQLEPLLPHLSPAELAQIASRLNQIEIKRLSYVETMKEEADRTTAYDIDAFHRAKGTDFGRSLAGVQEGRWPNWRQFREMVKYSMTDKTKMLQENRAYFLAVAEEARKPYSGQTHVPLPDNLIAKDFGDLYPIRGRRLFVSAEAVAALLRSEIALYRYHAAYDHYPNALAQLVPAYLNSVPNDPFGGGANIPLHYRVTNDGRSFLLYSLGPDLRDDGGKPKRNPYDDKPGDIVASHIWPQKANGGRKQ